MLTDLFIFLASLYAVFRGSTMATTHAAALSESFRLSKYVVGFIIVAVISILPETFISLNSAFKGVPEFGLGVLYGSNIADLTLVLAILAYASRRSLKVEPKILKNQAIYPLLLLLPLALGLDGYYSRPEGALLILTGAIFNYLALKSGVEEPLVESKEGNRYESVLWLLASMALLLAGAHFTVTSASAIALRMDVSPILVGMLVVGLGTTMPELFFSLRAVRRHDDSMALGNVLGTVLADATLLVGLLAMVSPFEFPKKIIYVTGLFMVVASVVLFQFMRTGRAISRREAHLLIAYWLTFVLVEFLVNS